MWLLFFIKVHTEENVRGKITKNNKWGGIINDDNFMITCADRENWMAGLVRHHHMLGHIFICPHYVCVQLAKRHGERTYTASQLSHKINKVPLLFQNLVWQLTKLGWEPGSIVDNLRKISIINQRLQLINFPSESFRKLPWTTLLACRVSTSKAELLLWKESDSVPF